MFEDQYEFKRIFKIKKWSMIKSYSVETLPQNSLVLFKICFDGSGYKVSSISKYPRFKMGKDHYVYFKKRFYLIDAYLALDSILFRQILQLLLYKHKYPVTSRCTTDKKVYSEAIETKAISLRLQQA